jgi:toxin-antitoxin system PIN domain toxin
MTSEARPARGASAAATRGDLPDVNVWLALSAPSHPHHEAAQSYWQQKELPRVWFNRVTMLALLRLLCQPKVMGPATVTLPRAAAVYGHFMEMPEVGFLAEPAGCDPLFTHMLAGNDGATPLPRLVTDMYLAAFAIAAGLRMVTFDRDFLRFDGLEVMRLTTRSH